MVSPSPAPLRAVQPVTSQVPADYFYWGAARMIQIAAIQLFNDVAYMNPRKIKPPDFYVTVTRLMISTVPGTSFPVPRGTNS